MEGPYSARLPSARSGEKSRRAPVNRGTVEERAARPVVPALSMIERVPKFDHTPVMLTEVVDLLADVPAGIFADLTLGGAGHATAILAGYPHLTLFGVDQDPLALDAARARLAQFDDRVTLHPIRFDSAPEVLRQTGTGQISGFLMDLGVSSPQLDLAERGFSYRLDGPLDMRMDPDADLSAADVVNGYEIAELVDVLRSYGDERHALRIARAIEKARPLATTLQLAGVISEAVPAAARRRGGHPAKRSFQAIRIEVNSELAILSHTIDEMIELLAPGGIGLILTYHSGEDRIAKDRMRRAVEGDTPTGLPIMSEFVWAFRGARTADEAEVAINRRARSARLRAISRTGSTL